jgi:hypothetical protein
LDKIGSQEEVDEVINLTDNENNENEDNVNSKRYKVTGIWVRKKTNILILKIHIK